MATENMNPEQVLVTGGTGFIAGWCLVELLRRGFHVRTTVRASAKEGAVRAALTALGVDHAHLTFAVADLTDDRSWDAAMAGCSLVLHVASPLAGTATNGEEKFIRPARDGTLRVLDAAARARVRRVVMTSAAAAARPPLSSALTSDETIWADPNDPQFDAYRRSKILAERAAWEFMETRDGPMELTSVLPGAVFGPVLAGTSLGSVRIIHDLLQGRPPALPALGFWVVDVRDLAGLHVRALLNPEAGGQRFLAAGEFLWMAQIAQILRQGMGAAGRRVPRRGLPSPLVRLLLPFLPQLRPLAPLLGHRFPINTGKARSVLGFAPRPVESTILDCARSLSA